MSIAPSGSQYPVGLPLFGVWRSLGSEAPHNDMTRAKADVPLRCIPTIKMRSRAFACDISTTYRCTSRRGMFLPSRERFGDAVVRLLVRGGPFAEVRGSTTHLGD